MFPSSPVRVHLGSSRLAIRLSAAAIVEDVLRLPSHWRVVVCQTDQAFIEATSNWDTRGAICEISPALPLSPNLQTTLLHFGRRAPLLIRTDVRPQSARDLLMFASELTNLCISLIGYDGLSRDVERITSSQLPIGAEQAILARMVNVRSDIRQYVVGGVVAARRKIEMPEFAALCRCSVRTLESRMRAANTIPPHSLIGWLVCLHALWWLEQTGGSIKTAASTAGFADAAAFSNYFLRHLGERPSMALERQGFWRTLDTFAKLLSSA